MPSRNVIVFVGVIIAAFMLLIFAASAEEGARFLNLPSQWILVSVFPILVALFLAGYVRKFKGFGIELESSLNSPISSVLDLGVASALTVLVVAKKQEVRYLYDLKRDRKLAIRVLSFELSRKGYYTEGAVIEYLTHLPNIQYLEIKTEQGEFNCYLPIDVLLGNNHQQLEQPFSRSKTRKFIKTLEAGRVEEEYWPFAYQLTVKSKTSLVEVLRLLRHEQIDAVPVISESGRYLGLAFRGLVESKVAELVLIMRSA